MWFTISAHDPDFEPGTRRNLDEIARHLAPSQITEAKSLAQQCLQTGYVDCTQASQAAPVSRTSDTIPSSHTRVPLRIDRGISFVPVEINGTLKLDFAIDSGASDVSVPADVFSTLKRTSTVKESDLIGQQSYVLADGSTTQSSIFKIRSLKIGELVVEDVKASVTPSHATLLLGQSFLERFKSWSIDNTTHELLLELRENR
jgi:clan AA aspartic protease (TIGR02281 family)